MSNFPIFITIGGQGSRLKCISPKDKQFLYWKDKRIIDWLLELFPGAKLLGNKKTNNRYETLLEISNLQNALIIDCDIIPFDINLNFNLKEDCVWCFESNKNKWGSVLIENNKLSEASENGNISNIKLSGAYYIANVPYFLDKMKNNNKNSIASSLTNCNIILENTFKRFGDVEDYYNALNI